MTVGCSHSAKIMAPSPAAHRAVLERTAGTPGMTPGSTVEQEALRRFALFYGVYSSEVIRAQVRQVYAEDAWFGDPFHAVDGIDAIEHYFLAMAEPVVSCTFAVDAVQRDGDDYYARWTMELVSKAAKGQTIEALGISHLRFNDRGEIVFQQDYWDTSVLLDRLPVVGFWTRLVKRRIMKDLTQ